MSESEETIVIILLVTAAAIGLFFALREVFLWYYKINNMLKYQAKTLSTLQKILNHQTTGKVYGDIDADIIIENNETGRIRGISQKEWDKMHASRKDLYVMLKK